MPKFNSISSDRKNKKREAKRISNRHKRKGIDFSFPHIKTAFVILGSTVVALLCSLYLNCIDSVFWSSIFANLFAGLVTGLILCLISGRKQRTIAELKNKLSFLKELHEEILDYFDAYHKMLSAPFTEEVGNQYELIYDAGVHANWAILLISQGEFRDILSFNPCEYCKDVFGYDVMEMLNANTTLHEFILMIEIDKPSKREILNRFESVDKPLRGLNSAVVREIKAIELKLESIAHTLL